MQISSKDIIKTQVNKNLKSPSHYGVFNILLQRPFYIFKNPEMIAYILQKKWDPLKKKPSVKNGQVPPKKIVTL